MIRLLLLCIISVQQVTWVEGGLIKRQFEREEPPTGYKNTTWYIKNEEYLSPNPADGGIGIMKVRRPMRSTSDLYDTIQRAPTKLFNKVSESIKEKLNKAKAITHVLHTALTDELTGHPRAPNKMSTEIKHTVENGHSPNNLEKDVQLLDRNSTAGKEQCDTDPKDSESVSQEEFGMNGRGQKKTEDALKLDERRPIDQQTRDDSSSTAESGTQTNNTTNVNLTMNRTNHSKHDCGQPNNGNNSNDKSREAGNDRPGKPNTQSNTDPVGEYSGLQEAGTVEGVLQISGKEIGSIASTATSVTQSDTGLNSNDRESNHLTISKEKGVVSMNSTLLPHEKNSTEVKIHAQFDHETEKAEPAVRPNETSTVSTSGTLGQDEAKNTGHEKIPGDHIEAQASSNSEGEAIVVSSDLTSRQDTDRIIFPDERERGQGRTSSHMTREGSNHGIDGGFITQTDEGLNHDVKIIKNETSMAAGLNSSQADTNSQSTSEASLSIGTPFVSLFSPEKQYQRTNNDNEIILISNGSTCHYGNIKEPSLDRRTMTCQNLTCSLDNQNEKSSLWVCDNTSCVVANVDYTKNDLDNLNLIECFVELRNIISVPDKCGPGEKLLNSKCRKVF